ncbi:MAG: iron ABC transporter permease [Thermoplasmatales archaeon]|nr:iron ABC transporter permease [Thermoplasmatales archaeon]
MEQVADIVAEREKLRIVTLKRFAFIGSSIVASVLLIGYSLTVGTYDISVTDVYKALFNYFIYEKFDVSDDVMLVVNRIRAPRVLMAFAGGMVLAIGGCITQTVLRNSLATPYTLGVSSGAGFGAALAILFGIALLPGVYGIILNAFLFSLIPAGVVIIASKRRNITPTTMVLCGVAISYIFSASNTIFQFFGEANAVKSVVFWMVGDLNSIKLSDLPFAFAATLLAFVATMLIARDLNILKMGDDTAKSLGVNAEALRTRSIVIACFTTAAIVSFTGSIGFICLLAPHISRIFVGGEMTYLVPASAFFGSCLLLMADLVAKTIIAPIMLPVGAITALIGGPLLVFLLLRKSSTTL